MQINRRQFTAGAAALMAGAGLSARARAEDKIKVKFATDWLAQGAHGGYYQALADGTYDRMGLDVEIISGGPQVNSRPLLAAGRVDFLMVGNLLMPFDDVRNGLPVKAVAGQFQKDPQILMAHKGVYSGFGDLVNAPKILLSKDGQFSYWKWMVKAKGFRDEQVGPYGYSMAPFFADKTLVQQGYAVSEPYEAAREKVETDVWLLADQGWSTYSSIVQTTDKLIGERPDVVQKFIDASAIGWYNFLYGDAKPGINAIVAANPDQSAERLAWENEALRSLGIVDSGDALTLGIGAMTAERIQAFYDLCVVAGVIEAGSVDPAAIADLSFVNKGVGLDVRKALTGQ